MIKIIKPHPWILSILLISSFLCSLLTFVPLCFSKTVLYDYGATGFLQQAKTLTGTTFDYEYDPVGNRKNMTVSPLDSDNDGLGNGEELNVYGTDPFLADTDNDGLMDGEEVDYWNNHLTENWDSDTDGDGIINLLDRDSDNDGYADGYEVARHTDPGDSTDYPNSIITPVLYLLLLAP